MFFTHISFTYIYLLTLIPLLEGTEFLIHQMIKIELEVFDMPGLWRMKRGFLFIYFPFIFISWRLVTLQYCSGFCHTLT